jgi:hypothetical protein
VSEKDWVHLGEEMSDVFIYTLRLAEICRIDLGHSVISIISSCDLRQRGDIVNKFSAKRCIDESDIWTCIDFMQTIENLHSSIDDIEPSTRNYSMEIQYHLGVISSLFYKKSEVSCGVGLISWDANDIDLLSLKLGNIIVSVLKIAKLMKFNMKDTLLGKIEKNERKYPSQLAQGSSAKYTAYSGKLKVEEGNTSSVFDSSNSSSSSRSSSSSSSNNDNCNNNKE